MNRRDFLSGAVALAALGGVTPRALDRTLLRKTLIANGVCLG